MSIQNITSKQNPRFRAALKLKTSRGRKQQQRFIIFGEREVQRAITSNNIKLVELYFNAENKPELSSSHLSSSDHSPDQFELSPELFSELQYGERTEAIAAVAERPEMSLQNLAVPDAALVVILQGIEKPGNIGAVLRSMDAVAANALILCEPQCDVLHPNSIRSSMGSVFTIPTAIATSEETVAWCSERNLPVFAASDSGATEYTSLDYKQGMAVALGNEANGLSSFWMSASSANQAEQKNGGLSPTIQRVSIPMRGISDSLNVSVAAAVLMFEAKRQQSVQ